MSKRTLIAIAALIAVAAIAGCRKAPVVASTGDPAQTSLQAVAVYSIDVVEPSGLAFFLADSTLYTVSDQPDGMIYKLSLTGAVLQTLPVHGNDMEGVTFTPSYDTICFIEEGLRNIVWSTLNGKRIDTLHIDVPEAGKNGLEGITINTRTRDIFAAHQETPALLVQISPARKEIKRTEILFAPTLSDICYDKTEDVLWLLSAKAAVLYKVTLNGVLIKSWSIPVTKAEGITLGVNNTMYMVCDAESKLYVFNKPQ